MGMADKKEYLVQFSLMNPCPGIATNVSRIPISGINHNNKMMILAVPRVKYSLNLTGLTTPAK